MSVENIASLAVAKETCDPWILAKLAKFAADMLWENCSKYDFAHFLEKVLKSILSIPPLTIWDGRTCQVLKSILSILFLLIKEWGSK